MHTISAHYKYMYCFPIWQCIVRAIAGADRVALPTRSDWTPVTSSPCRFQRHGIKSNGCPSFSRERVPYPRTYPSFPANFPREATHLGLTSLGRRDRLQRSTPVLNPGSRVGSGASPDCVLPQNVRCPGGS